MRCGVTGISRAFGHDVGKLPYLPSGLLDALNLRMTAMPRAGNKPLILQFSADENLFNLSCQAWIGLENF